MFRVDKNKTVYMINNKVMGEVDYPYINDNTVNITHTFVDQSLRGQGIADKMMNEVFKYLRKKNIQVKCTCSYAISWLEKHSEYHDLKVD